MPAPLGHRARPVVRTRGVGLESFDDRETPLEIYTPLAQDTGRTVAIVARTSIDAEAAPRSLTNLVKEMNGDLPVRNVSTIENPSARHAAVLGVFASSFTS